MPPNITNMDRDVEDGSSSNNSLDNVASSSNASPPDNNWDVSSAAKSIRSRLRGGGGGGRHSPTSAASDISHGITMVDSDKLPLLRMDSSDSDDFALPRSLMLPHTSSGGGGGARSTSSPQSHLQWLRLFALSVLLSCLMYYSPGFFLEAAYFPARGRMMPGGLKSIISTPTFHYDAVQAAADYTTPAAAAAAAADDSNVQIPRIVHVTYKSRDELPPEWSYSLQQWEQVNPSWQVRFWSDKDIEAFVHTEYPHMEELHKSYKYMIQRVDSVRYMILHHFGGVYSDMDIYPATALDKLLLQWEESGKNVLLAETFNKGVTNAFMAAAPQSAFMSCVIDNLPHYQHKFHHVIGWQHWEVLSSAGSTFLWGMVGHCQDDQVEILAARAFRGCSVCDAWETGQPPASCDTEWLHHSTTNSSWHQHESWVHAFFFTIAYSFFCRPFRACFVLSTILVALFHRRRHRRRLLKA